MQPPHLNNSVLDEDDAPNYGYDNVIQANNDKDYASSLNSQHEKDHIDEEIIIEGNILVVPAINTNISNML